LSVKPPPMCAPSLMVPQVEGMSPRASMPGLLL